MSGPSGDLPTAGLSALRKLLKGLALSDADRALAQATESALGLARPLSEYAPRTQRRYLSAAQRGITAEVARAQENQPRRLRYWTERNREKYRLQSAFTRDTVEGLLENTGISPDLIERLLKEQAAASDAYLKGDRSKGRELWNLTSAELDVMGEDAEYLRMLDPLRYYHPTRSA